MTSKERLTALITELSQACAGKTPDTTALQTANNMPAKDFLFYTGMLFNERLTQLSTIARNTLAEAEIHDDFIHYRTHKKSIYSFIER